MFRDTLLYKFINKLFCALTSGFDQHFNNDNTKNKI